MNAHNPFHSNAPGRAYGYAASRTRHAVNFFCDAPSASKVSIAGDFNEWNADSLPMQRTPDGRWTARLDLVHGHHRYLFLVDGKPMLDPRASGKVRQSNPFHDAASLVAVS